MPQSSGNLRRLFKSKHQYVERHLNIISSIIKNAIANSSAFESIAEEIRKAHVEALAMKTLETENSESVSPEHAMNCTVAEVNVSKFQEEKKTPELSMLDINNSSSNGDKVGTVKRESIDNGLGSSPQPTKDVTPTASVQVMKKPVCAFGALFGNSSRGKTKPLKGNDSEQEKNENKVEQIKASVILPFYSFSGGKNSPETLIPTEKNSVSLQTVQSPEQPSKTTTMEEVIPLENSTDGSESPPENPKIIDGLNDDAEMCKPDVIEMTGTHPSRTDLSSGFQQCSRFVCETNSLQENDRPPEFSPFLSFDYATARKVMKFGEETGREDDDDDMVDGVLPASRGAKKGIPSVGGDDEQRERGQQPRRRQAFPPSGNRSATYRC